MLVSSGSARGLDAGPHWIANTHSNSHWTKPHNSLAGRASNIRWGKHVRMLMLLCYTEKAPNADAIVYVGRIESEVQQLTRNA